jgi:hypothetical protein
VTTAAKDELRTGWYPDQTTLTPGLVSGGTFGPQFSTPVDGQVYAQPLVANNTLLVATETNNIYGLDPGNGARRWSRNLGTPWNPADRRVWGKRTSPSGPPAKSPKPGTAPISPPPPIWRRCHRAAIEGRWATTMRFFAGPGVLVIDELGYLPLPAEAASALFQVISQRYLKTSIVLTSNRGVGIRGARSSATPPSPRLSNCSG